MANGVYFQAFDIFARTQKSGRQYVHNNLVHIPFSGT